MRYPLLKYVLAVIVIGGAAYAVQSCKKKSSPYIYPPEIMYITTSGCLLVGNAIQFGYYDDSGEPDNIILWKFGDGTTSANGVHTYTMPGTYAVTLIINNDVTDAYTDSIHVIQEFGSSHYTSQIGGARLWNGYLEGIYPAPIEQQVTDSSLAVQVIDAGTIVFMADTMRLISIDTINNKVLMYSDCEETSVSYYYSTNSIAYSSTFPEGKDTRYSELHTP